MSFFFCLSGTFSDSGRNSMSSLPTHSTSGSLSASTGPVSHGDGSSAPANGLSKGVQPNFPPWVSGNSANLDCSYRAGLNSGGSTSKGNGDASSPLSADEPSALSETSGGIRSPITTDESLIERLEQRLLERETELHELQVPSCCFTVNRHLSSVVNCSRQILTEMSSSLPQVSFEEKEEDTCQLFDERQRYCAEEMEGLKQRCSTKLRQVSQMAARTQQALQLQVRQLQVSPHRFIHNPPYNLFLWIHWDTKKKKASADAFKILPCTQAEWNEKSTFVQAEKERLLEDVSKLTREKGLVELRLRSYEMENTQLAPTLEETQWEVSHESFMWNISKFRNLVAHSTNWYNLDDCRWSVGTSSYSTPTGKICHFAPYLRNRDQSKESGIQTSFIFFAITDSVASETSGTLRTFIFNQTTPFLYYELLNLCGCSVPSCTLDFQRIMRWTNCFFSSYKDWVKWFCLMRKVWLSVMNLQRNISNYVFLFKRASANKLW